MLTTAQHLIHNSNDSRFDNVKYNQNIILLFLYILIILIYYYTEITLNGVM